MNADSRTALPARAELLDYLLSFDLFDQTGGKEEGRAYAEVHVDRFLKTLAYLPQLPPGARALELGSAPYMMSFLVMKYLRYELTPANFFGDYGERLLSEMEVTVSSKRFGDSHRFAFKLFNLELDPFPYGDGEFDVVLCCEILEHLATDPAHMLGEIHRVLKPGGHLVLTTPNAVKIDNALKLLRGHNVFHKYSGGGVYERHNREYPPGELFELLRIHNFEPRVVVDDAYRHGRLYRLAARFGLLKGRRDNLFAVGRKHGITTVQRPRWLYDNPNGPPVARCNYLIMGQSDRRQLGAGWSEYERWPPGIRWTAREATAYLMPERDEQRVGFHAAPPPRRVSGRLLVNGFEAGVFALEAGQGADVILPVPPEAWAKKRRGEIFWFDVTIAVDEPLVPARDLGRPGDHRELGVPVEKMGLLD